MSSVGFGTTKPRPAHHRPRPITSPTLIIPHEGLIKDWVARALASGGTTVVRDSRPRTAPGSHEPDDRPPKQHLHERLDPGLCSQYRYRVHEHDRSSIAGCGHVRHDGRCGALPRRRLRRTTKCRTGPRGKYARSSIFAGVTRWPATWTMVGTCVYRTGRELHRVRWRWLFR